MSLKQKSSALYAGRNLATENINGLLDTFGLAKTLFVLTDSGNSGRLVPAVEACTDLEQVREAIEMYILQNTRSRTTEDYLVTPIGVSWFTEQDRKNFNYALRNAYFQNGGSLDSESDPEISIFLTEDEEPVDEPERNYERKKISIGGLDFVSKYDKDNFEVVIYGLLPGEEKMYKLVHLISTEKGLEIADFFYTRNYRWPYYKKASVIAKANDRTIAGIVMGIIKEIADDEEVIFVGKNAWTRTVGESYLTSALLKQAAYQILKGGGDLEAFAFKTDAQKYLEKRWKRLYPDKKVSFSEFLENTRQHGWYGAWFVRGRTTKETMITTKKNMVFVDRCA